MLKYWKSMPVIVTVLLLAACGNKDEAPASPEADQIESSEQGVATEPTQEPQQAPQSTLLCENPAPIELGLGETIDATIEDPIWTQCFWVEVPDGLSQVAIELSGLSADLNLEVGYGFLVTLQYNIGEFWRSGESGTANELLTIDNPTPGPYFISVGIAGPKDPSQFTLAVRAEPETNTTATGTALTETGTCASPATELAVGSTTNSEVVGRDEDPLPRRYFCVQVPDSMSSLAIGLTGLDGDLEIFVRRTRPAEWMDRTRGGSERQVIIENPESGAYYIDIAGAYPGAGSSFTLSVTNP